VRQDKFANEHRVVPEVEKETANKGKYIHPTEWNQPADKGIDYEMSRQQPAVDASLPQMTEKVRKALRK
jgi:hypothetical protein